jgi:hypothetical protein
MSRILIWQEFLKNSVAIDSNTKIPVRKVEKYKKHEFKNIGIVGTNSIVFVILQILQFEFYEKSRQ